MSNEIKRLLDKQRGIFHTRLDKVLNAGIGNDVHDIILDVMLDLPYPKYSNLEVANGEGLEEAVEELTEEEKDIKKMIEEDESVKLMLEQGKRITVVALPGKDIGHTEFMALVEALILTTNYKTEDIENYIIEWSLDIKSKREN